VCGSARTVVWEGRSREAPPYPESGRLLYLAVVMTSGFIPTNGQFSIPAAIGLPST
jgi:hypothetical protein